MPSHIEKDALNIFSSWPCPEWTLKGHIVPTDLFIISFSYMLCEFGLKFEANYFMMCFKIIKDVQQLLCFQILAFLQVKK